MKIRKISLFKIHNHTLVIQETKSVSVDQNRPIRIVALKNFKKSHKTNFLHIDT